MTWTWHLVIWFTYCGGKRLDLKIFFNHNDSVIQGRGATYQAYPVLIRFTPRTLSWEVWFEAAHVWLDESQTGSQCKQ